MPRAHVMGDILLPDGYVLIVNGAEWGTHEGTRHFVVSPSITTNVEFPTDLRLKACCPPYPSDTYAPIRAIIIHGDQLVGYGLLLSLIISVQHYQADNTNPMSVNVIAPSFTTHSLAMNQRMVILVARITQVSLGMYNVGLIGHQLLMLHLLGTTCYSWCMLVYPVQSCG